MVPPPGGRSSNGWSILQGKQPARLLWGQQGMSLRDLTSSTGVLRPTSVAEATTMIWIPPVDLRCWFEFGCVIVRYCRTFLSTWSMKAISQSFTILISPCYSHMFPHPCFKLLQLGPRLAVVYALKGRISDLLAWFGIKCSTWVMVNAGTSHRSICSSIGDLGKASVKEGNRMLERTNIVQKRLVAHITVTDDLYKIYCCNLLSKQIKTNGDPRFAPEFGL